MLEILERMPSNNNVISFTKVNKTNSMILILPLLGCNTAQERHTVPSSTETERKRLNYVTSRAGSNV